MIDRGRHGTKATHERLGLFCRIWLSRFLGRGMVVDDLPAFGKLAEDHGEEASGPCSVGHRQAASDRAP